MLRLALCMVASLLHPIRVEALLRALLATPRGLAPASNIDINDVSDVTEMKAVP